MPIDLKSYTDPKTTAILVCDSDEYHLAPTGPVAIPELRDVALRKGIIPKMAKLNDAARRAGAKVFYRRMARWPGNAGAMAAEPVGPAAVEMRIDDPVGFGLRIVMQHLFHRGAQGFQLVPVEAKPRRDDVAVAAIGLDLCFRQHRRLLPRTPSVIP